MSLRIGIGYDVHKFGLDRDLIIGGVTIPYDQGLLGHSDADVLTHAIMDAMLGALALGSIGDFFPDNDPKYKDINSLKLLDIVHKTIQNKGYSIQNIDSVLIAQAPKFQPHILSIRQSLATQLNIDINGIGVKATTTETLGFEGRKEGIAAQAIVLLSSR